MTKFRMVRVFDKSARPSGEREYRVETAEKLTEKEALALMAELGSPYQGSKYLPNWSENQTEKTEERVPTGEAVMPRVNGKSFHCDCGCNVFTKWICAEHGEEYKCNACGTIYEGVPA